MYEEVNGVLVVLFALFAFAYLFTGCGSDVANIGDAGVISEDNVETTTNDTDEYSSCYDYGEYDETIDEDTVEEIDYRYDLYPTNEIDNIF